MTSSPFPTLYVSSWFQIQHLGADLHPGDVLLSNHPSAGGSHLPDLTVITPVRDATLVTVRATEVSGATDCCCLHLRCFGQARHGLYSMWLAEGTMQTLEVSRQALCLLTLPHCNRRVPFFCPSNWSKEASSRKRVSWRRVTVRVW